MAHVGSGFAAALCALLACCAPAPGPDAKLTMGELSAIVTPLTYRELLGTKCGEPSMAVKTAFLADLKAAGAPDALMAEVEAEAARIEAAERDTPNEYVCTADLYETTDRNAAVGQKAWADLKSHQS